MNSTQGNSEFGEIDYAVLGAMLSVSMGIGIYFGFFEKSASNIEEYLLGGRQMKTIPIAISLIASQVSCNTIILLPLEIYLFGTLYTILLFSLAVTITFTSFIVLPVFYHCKITNVYEYFELRFDARVRKMATIFFILSIVASVPIASYIPAITFSQMCGINVHVINAIITFIFTSYTVLGGIKAVVWTDVVQATIMVGSSIAVFIIALINIGGFNVAWQRLEDGGRIRFFNMDLSLTARDTFWNHFFNQCVVLTGIVAVNQVAIQRLLAVPTIGHSRRALYILGVGFFSLLLLSFSLGGLMFATYYDCDPYKAGFVDKPDQLLPYIVTDIIGHLTGMPGLFIATIFSASLSTISAQLNSLAGIIYLDIIQKMNCFKHTEISAKLSMKVIIVILGIYIVLAGFFVETFNHLLQIVTTLLSITMGVTVGIFTLGTLTPWANSNGVFYSSITSVLVISWIAIGGQLAIRSGSLSYPPLATSTEGCYNSNESLVLIIQNSTSSYTKSEEIDDDVFFLYKLSFNWYGIASIVITWVLGLTISFITGPTDPRKVGKFVYAPCIHWMLPKGDYKETLEPKNEDNAKNS